jgi:predicted nucleic acid-binding protein
MRARLASEVVAVSVVTIAELRRGAIAARWSEQRMATLDERLREYVVLSIDRDVAEAWALMRVRCDRLGRRKSENDLWVAAIAGRYRVPLATLDRDHLDIPGLRVIGEDGAEVSVPE